MQELQVLLTDFLLSALKSFWISLGAGEDLYTGRMGHVRACPGLPPAEGRDQALFLLHTILPRFYFEHSCFMWPITPPQIKSLFCINSFIAGGMSLALMGTVASACLPHVCVCLFLRGPRGLPAALWAVDGQIASLPRDGHRDLWARACSTSSLRKNCWRWQEPWDEVWTQLFVEQGQPLPVSASRWPMWSQHRHLQL